ncbi:hypothetical protein KIN20_037467 [Parelaphostrongylus tenuis]|uniref:Uncharacterized protein n=1 Tax=Parelaphostrongylus tenuis TaxID=148309 RepID=A0AAD5REL6_PARTN|nr:hypothetical protein KIN20_037467 [Parelaphostrongylus tenuis]
MFISYRTFAAHARIPMIKFIGARLPRPNFARVAASGPENASASSGTSMKSSGSSGQTRHGQSISEEQLPTEFRRPPLSQEECDAINAGGAYGL